MLPLAAYESSSDSEGSDTEQPSSAMPALPAFFSPAVPKAVDPAKHHGRVRTKPHIENNWATHVYIEVPASDAVKRIVQPLISDQVHSLVQEDDEELLHVSLSRPVFLKEHQLDSFAQNIREHVAQVGGGFCITFAQVSVLTNDEKTRSFITVEVGAGYSELQSLLKSVDAVMEKYRLPLFYKPARFHASIAWCLEPIPLEAAIGTIPTIDLDELTNVSHMVSRLVVKMGNRVVKIPLSNS